MHHPPDARNTRSSSSEQSGPAPTKMKRRRHSTVLEWHASSGVVSYIHLDRLEMRVQQGHVVYVSETFRYRFAVTSTNRKAPQQRGETVADDARLHEIRVEVDGIDPSRHVHHVVSFFTEGVRTRKGFLGGDTTLDDGVRPIPVPPSLGCSYSCAVSSAAAAMNASIAVGSVGTGGAAANGLVKTELRNPNMGPMALW